MKIISIVFIAILFTSNCVAIKTSTVDDLQDIKCSLNIISDHWIKGSPAIVNIKIENLSAEPKKFKVITTFKIDEILYNGPVRLSDVSEHLPANTSYKLYFKPGQNKLFDVDLSKLKWGKCISAVWPHDDFFDIVPPGNYKLRFQIEIDSEDIPIKIYSNTADILVM